MSLIGEASAVLKSLANIFAVSKTEYMPKSYDDACIIARERAKQDTAQRRIDLSTEKMAKPSREAYSDKMKNKEKENDKFELDRFDYHLNNILKMYGLENKK
jgi:hypothetical protein